MNDQKQICDGHFRFSIRGWIVWMAIFGFLLALSLREFNFTFSRFYFEGLEGSRQNYRAFWWSAILENSVRSLVLLFTLRIVVRRNAYEPGVWFLVNGAVIIIVKLIIGVVSEYENREWTSGWIEIEIQYCTLASALLFTIPSMIWLRKKSYLWGSLFGLFAILQHAYVVLSRLGFSSVLLEQGAAVRLALMLLLIAICSVDFKNKVSRGFLHWIGVSYFLIGFN